MQKNLFPFTRRPRDKKENRLFFFNTRTTYEVFYNKRGASSEQGVSPNPGRRYFQKYDEVRKKWGPRTPPGSPLHSSPSSRRPARLRLDVQRAFLIFILVEGVGAVAAALAFGAAFDSTADGAVDLHEQGLVPIKLEGQILPPGQAGKHAKDFHPLPRCMASSETYSARTLDGPLGQPSTCSQKPTGLRFTIAMANESGR